MMKSLKLIIFEVCVPPSFYGTNDLESFIHMYQITVREKDWLRALDIALKATPARWWATHKGHIEDRSQLRKLMMVQFDSTSEYDGAKYTRHTSPKNDVDVCI